MHHDSISTSTRRSVALAVTACAAAFGGASIASAQLLTYDGFGNGPLPDLAGSNGGTGWVGPWADYGDTITEVSGDGLSYPGLVTSPGAAVTGPGDGVYPMSTYARGLPTPPLGTQKLYISFLLRPDEFYGSYGGLQFGTWPYAMTVGFPGGMYALGLMVSEGLGDISNVDLIAGETYFVVCRISKNTPGSGLTYRLYYAPTVGAAEPTFPLAQFTVPSPSTLPTSLRIANQGGFTTDEIRVGTTWDSVLPAPPPPCPGDLNQSGAVDAADLSMLLGYWGTPNGDLNGDSDTNGADLSVLLGSWGSCL